MMTHAKRAGLLIALVLAACVAQTPPPPTPTPVAVNPPPAPPPPPPPVSQRADEALAVTGSRIPAPEGRTRAAIGGIVGNYAQSAPQPMPGDIDRENYEDVDTNPIHVVSEDPISTFSIDVDSASYSNVRRFLNEGRL